MTEFEFEILKFLYYVLMAGVMVIKFCFIVLICAMLVEYILSLLDGFKQRFKK